jgi:ribosomal protein L29
MNDELSTSPKSKQSLDARFASRPHTYERLHQIADMMDEAMAQGCTADEAEARAIEQIEKLGRELLTDWAEQKQQQSLEQSQKENPSAIRHIKKK